jgi:hypothetical protein
MAKKTSVKAAAKNVAAKRAAKRAPAQKKAPARQNTAPQAQTAQQADFAPPPAFAEAAPQSYQPPPSTPQTNPNEAMQALADSKLNFGQHDPTAKVEADKSTIDALRRDAMQGEEPEVRTAIEPMEPERPEPIADDDAIAEVRKIIDDLETSPSRAMEAEFKPVEAAPEPNHTVEADRIRERAMAREEQWENPEVENDDLRARFSLAVDEVFATTFDDHRQKMLDIHKKRLQYDDTWSLVVDLVRHCVDSGKFPIVADVRRRKDTERMMAHKGRPECVVCGMVIPNAQAGQKVGCNAAGVMYGNGMKLTAPLVDLCPLMKKEKENDPRWYNEAMGLMEWVDGKEENQEN